MAAPAAEMAVLSTAGIIFVPHYALCSKQEFSENEREERVPRTAT